MGQDDAVEGDGADIFGADIIVFLRGGQQRMQDLDRRLEHLDEFEEPLRGAVEPAGIAVGIRVVLAVQFEHADVDFSDQAGNVLVILIAGLGFRNRDLTQPRRVQFHDGEFEISPPNSSRRLTAQGDIRPGSRRGGMPNCVSSSAAIWSGWNRPSGLSKIGLSCSGFEHINRVSAP